MDEKKQIEATRRPSLGEDVGLGFDDASAIPKGSLDPVYEAKARVLNRAVQASRQCRDAF